LGCGANFTKQLAAINNAGCKLAAIHITIIFITQPAAVELNYDSDHDDTNHGNFKW
jgi:hypothetical protein